MFTLTQLKLAFHYTRYIVAMLHTIGFGISLDN